MATVTESAIIADVWTVEPETPRGRAGSLLRDLPPVLVSPGTGDGAGQPLGQRRPGPSSGCTTTSTRRTTGCAPGVRPGWCCTTCGRARPPRERPQTLDLGEDNGLGVFIPPGVAHGFASLTDLTLTYLVDSYYNPDDELGVAWDDPEIAADWGVEDPILSGPRPGQPPPGRHRSALGDPTPASGRDRPPRPCGVRARGGRVPSRP